MFIQVHIPESSSRSITWAKSQRVRFASLRQRLIQKSVRRSSSSTPRRWSSCSPLSPGDDSSSFARIAVSGFSNHGERIRDYAADASRLDPSSICSASAPMATSSFRGVHSAAQIELPNPRCASVIFAHRPASGGAVEDDAKPKITIASHREKTEPKIRQQPHSSARQSEINMTSVLNANRRTRKGMAKPCHCNRSNFGTKCAPDALKFDSIPGNPQVGELFIVSEEHGVVRLPTD